ncbi:MAG: lipocalin-like domain-containing protein [Usitatibacter sp.]
MHDTIRRTLRSLSVVAVAGLAWGVASEGWAQQKPGDAAKQIVGVWKLTASQNTGKDGVTKVGSFGPNPSGQLIFTSSGRYASVNTRSDLPKFASGNRLQGTPEENKAVVQGSNANFGTYTVSPDGKVLKYKVEGGTWAPWNGTEQTRKLALNGNEMKLTLEAPSVGGTSLLTYKRVK